MAAKTKYSTVSLPIELLKQIDSEVRQSPAYVSRAQYIRTAIDEKLSTSKSSDEELTVDEKSHLDAWARERPDLSHLEEPALRDLLLQENQHVWSWLLEKVDQSVEYLLMQKRN